MDRADHGTMRPSYVPERAVMKTDQYAFLFLPSLRRESERGESRDDLLYDLQ